MQPGPVWVEVTVAAGGGEAAEARLVRGVPYSTVQRSTVHYSTVQYSTVQYSTVQYLVRGVPALGGRPRDGGGQQQQHRAPHGDWRKVTLITECRCEELIQCIVLLRYRGIISIT